MQTKYQELYKEITKKQKFGNNLENGGKNEAEHI
jgi:hypothetical protein